MNEIERMNDRYLDHQKKLLRQKDQLIIQGQDLGYQFKQAEQTAAQLEISSGHLLKELESVRLSNDAMLDRHHSLREELESLGSHVTLLGEQN